MFTHHNTAATHDWVLEEDEIGFYFNIFYIYFNSFGGIPRGSEVCGGNV